MICKIIFLLSFLNVLVNAAPSNENERREVEDNIIKDVKDKWQMKFYKYDIDYDCSISATELQTLLFNELNGFVTIRLATDVILLLDRSGEGKIRFDHLEKIKPIINMFSKAVSEWKKFSIKNNDNWQLYENETISEDGYMGELLYYYFTVFKSPDEVQELINLIDKNENGEIKIFKYTEIARIMQATVELAYSCKIFSKNTDKPGVMTIKYFNATAILMKELNDYKPDPDLNTSDYEKATELLKKFDANDDGVIEFSEFLNYIFYSYKYKHSIVNQSGWMKISDEEMADMNKYM